MSRHCRHVRVPSLQHHDGETMMTLLVGFATVCAAEVVVGTLLWRRRHPGRWLSLALLPIEATYWLGFALPFGPPRELPGPSP